jgi:uncharacterized lipoprotein YajG
MIQVTAKGIVTDAPALVDEGSIQIVTPSGDARNSTYIYLADRDQPLAVIESVEDIRRLIEAAQKHSENPS